MLPNRPWLLLALILVAGPARAGITFNVDHIDTSDFVEKHYITFYIDYLDDTFAVVEPAPSPDNLEVYANGDLVEGKVEVLRFAELDEPVAAGLVLGAHGDYVEPITGEDEESAISVFDLERDAAKAFIQKLSAGANDRVAVFFYYENLLDAAVPFGSNMNLARDAVERYVLKQRGSKMGLDGMPLAPKLYRFLRDIVEDQTSSPDLPRRRILIVMSDGRDTDAENPKKVQKRIADIVEPAKANQVKIYTVGFTLDTPKYLSDFGRLAAGTGGVARTIQLRDAGQTPDVSGMFEEIGDELKKQLVLRFSPGDLDGGKFYRFKVKLKSPDASSEFEREVPVPELPVRWKGILLWIGLVLGGVVLLIVLIKVIGAIVAARRESAGQAHEREQYNGPSLGRLVAIEGPYTGETFHLTDEVTRFGSVAGNHVILQDPGVSKRHCAIRVEEDKLRYEIADLGSTNGTFVNGQKVTKAYLKDGDNIQLGTTKLQFHLK